MCHRCDLVLRIEKDDAAFHQVCDVDMHKWLAVQSENRSFSFRANASLGIAEDFAMESIMDVVAMPETCRSLQSHRQKKADRDCRHRKKKRRSHRRRNQRG